MDTKLRVLADGMFGYYRWELGFEIDGVLIPDPTKFSGAHSALDLSGKRDANGLLHRQMVALKSPLKIGWSNMDRDMICGILDLVKGESFSFKYPDPVTGAMNTRTCYAGDRSWEFTQMVNEYGRQKYMGSLEFSVIEF